MALFIRLYWAYGLYHALRLFIAIKTGATKLSLPGLAHPVYFRKGTSDFVTLHSVIFNKSYDIKFYTDCSYIIDAGANVGYSTIFFANRFPAARILAIEPDKNNFELLKKNTALYPNVKCIQGGVWSKDCTLKIVDESAEEWSFRVEEDFSPGAEGIRGMAINSLMLANSFPRLDVLKVDIEGSEKELFSAENYKEWLPKVKHLIIEMHDGLIRGSSKAVMSAIVQYDFSLKHKGENLIFVNHKPAW